MCGCGSIVRFLDVKVGSESMSLEDAYSYGQTLRLGLRGTDRLGY